MKRTIYLILFIVGVGAILIWLLRKPVAIQPVVKRDKISQTNTPTITSSIQIKSNSPDEKYHQRNLEELRIHKEQMKRDSEIELAKWKSPIIYYGKVVDENGNPVQGAQASYNASALDNTLNQMQITGSVTSDERGIFKIDGINGIGLMVEVTHTNYYPYPNNSTGFSKRSLPRKGYFSDSEEKAEIFQMHSKGHPMPLIFHRDGFHAPLNGTDQVFLLLGGKKPNSASGQAEVIGQLQIQGLKGEPDPQNGGHYDWKVQIAVRRGGIFESTNDFDFVAPEAGYQQTMVIGFSKNDPAWRSSIDKKLFVKLANYCVRVRVYIDVYHDLYFSSEYFVNPDGSRNLEPN